MKILVKKKKWYKIEKYKITGSQTENQLLLNVENWHSGSRMNSRAASALSNVLHAERLLLQGLRLTAILEHSDGDPRQVQISVFGIKLPWSRFSNNALRDKWVSYVIQ